MGESPERVQFPIKERDVLKLWEQRLSLKAIAGALEISETTVRARLERSCERARVPLEEIRLFVFQNPHILEAGRSCKPGLHIPVMRNDGTPDEVEFPCRCGDPECLGFVEVVLKKA